MGSTPRLPIDAPLPSPSLLVDATAPPVPPPLPDNFNNFNPRPLDREPRNIEEEEGTNLPIRFTSATCAMHEGMHQDAQPSVRPRPSTIRPTSPPPPVRLSTVRRTLNRSTAPTVAHPQPAAPAVAKKAHFSQVKRWR